MSSSFTFHRKEAVERYVDRLEDAVEIASAQGADHAAELAPLGKGKGRATGANPRYFSVKLQTTRDFKARNKSRSVSRQRELERLTVLRSLNRGDLTKEVKPEDVKFFRFSAGSRRGQRPDVLDVRPARGPGGEVVKGAITHYEPGRLKKNIQPFETTREGTRVSGGWSSDAPYSNVVEKGFHHKGGTEVAARPFMEPAAEGLRDAWNSGKFFKE